MQSTEKQKSYARFVRKMIKKMNLWGSGELLLEKYPDITNRDIKLLLRERAVDMGLPHTQQGWGLLDVERLLR